MAEEKGFLDRYAIAQDATLPAPEIDIGAMRRYRLARPVDMRASILNNRYW